MALHCSKCGSRLPNDAAFCHKCGSPTSHDGSTKPARSRVVARSGVFSLKCPSCGAPLTPSFGEMILTCEYCGSGVALGSQGWANIRKHTILPLRITSKAVVDSTIHSLMNEGLLRWHVWERSRQEDLSLVYVPYWIVSVSARTSIVAVDATGQLATTVATAAILGSVAAAGGRGGRRGSAMDAAILGGVVAGSMGRRGGRAANTRAYQMSENHNYPVVAVRAFNELQPPDYEFALRERLLFDRSKVPRGVKVLNGDVGEEDAKQQARTLVDQLQSQKAHEKYRMIQQISTDIDIGQAELLHAPVWVGRYLFKRKRKIVVIVDANSGSPINSVGLDD